MRAQFVEWPCPVAGGEMRLEMARVFDGQRGSRLLVIPPLFEEANKLRFQLGEVMRRLDLSGIDSFLPDLPGWNESLVPLNNQTLTGWRASMSQAAEHFGATHVLAVRGGALLRPESLPGWDYAPYAGKKILNSLLRARVVSSREASQHETRESLAEIARSEGITLAGWELGAELFTELEAAEVPTRGDTVTEIEQTTIGGRPLWLRAEPDADPEQADALAAIIVVGMVGE